LILLLELAALGAALTWPRLRAAHIEVEGARHMTSEAIRQAAQVPTGHSLLLLQEREIEARLERLPWVETARVQARLPDRVRIRVREYVPVAVLRVRESNLLISASGRVLGPAGAAGTGLTIAAPAAEDRAGRTAVDPRLLRLLLDLGGQWEGAYGVGLKEFQLNKNLELSAMTVRGWPVQFGQMVTDDQRASLNSKVQALSALRARYNFGTDAIEYINVMNPGTPTVKTPSASPSATPAAPRR
jgi:hypothetical protein